MRGRLWFTLAAFGLSFLGSAFAAEHEEWGPAKGSLSLSLTAAKEKFEVSELVRLTVRIKNVSEQDVRIESRHGFCAQGLRWCVDGRPVKPGMVARDLSEKTLKPGEVLQYIGGPEPLAHLRERLGAYKVRVAYPLGGDADEDVSSSEITVTIYSKLAEIAEWGERVNGLRIGLAQTDELKARSPTTVLLLIENGSDEPKRLSSAGRFDVSGRDGVGKDLRLWGPVNLLRGAGYATPVNLEVLPPRIVSLQIALDTVKWRPITSSMWPDTDLSEFRLTGEVQVSYRGEAILGVGPDEQELDLLNPEGLTRQTISTGTITLILGDTSQAQ